MMDDGRTDAPGSGTRPEQEPLRDPNIVQKLLAISSGLVYIYDLAEERNVYANRDMLTLLGYSVEDVLALGSSLLPTIIHPEDAGKVARHHAQFNTLQDDEIRTLDYRVCSTEGQVHWLRSCDIVLTRGEDGRPVRILGAAEDITEHKLAEAALLQSERKFRALFESLQEGVVLHELVRDGTGEVVDYRILELNPAFERHTGQKAASARGRLATEAYGTDVAPYLKEYSGVAMGGDPIAFESYFPPLEKHFRVSVVSPKHEQFVTVFEDITAWKRVEAQLRHGQAMLARTESIAHIGSWEWEVASDTVTWSDELFRILQRDPAAGALAYAEHPQVYPPEDMARLDQAVKVASLEGVPYELELKAVRADGEVRICLARGFPRVGPDGKVSHLFGSLQDITEQKCAEQTLRASEERFRLAMAATSDGIWDWDIVSGEVYYSPAYTRMLGYEPDEFAARIEAWEEMVHPADRAEVLAANEACIRGAIPSFEVEYRMTTREGATKWILGRGKAIARDAQGMALRLVGTHVDITERKRAEEALRASEGRFRTLFNNSQVGMFRTRLDGSEILELNDKYLQLLGKTREEVANQPSTLVWADPQARVEMVRRLLADGCVTDFEMSIRHANGQALECVTSIKLFRDEGILEGSLQDISGRKRAEEEKAKLQAQLLQTQKMESLGTLSGGIAHDMNNVLGAILGLASANLEIQPPGTPVHRAFETIVKAASRGGEMVRSLLAFARQSPSEDRVLDVNTLLREETRLLERTTLAKVQLEVDLEAGLHPIRGDASALTHAFMNLCVNAVDAMPEQGTLTLRTRNAGPDWIEVMVVDTGTGMTKEVLDHAMEPFFTTKEVGKGTGLGLSMVYSTVKAHSGDIEVVSRPGQGTQVRMRFPACHTTMEHLETNAGRGSETTGRTLNVLLVDDDDLIQSSMGAILQGMGHVVYTSPCGEHALDAIEAGFVPDVVILDMNMPGLGGIGTLPLIRGLLPVVPVLLATGRTDQKALDLSKAHPHVTLLPKPFTITELKESLEPTGL